MPLSPFDNRVQMDAADSPKKPNYNISETKAKGEDYTTPSKAASQTEDDNLRVDPVEEEYETPDNRKNPEKDAGKPGIRTHQDPFADVGLPGQESILPPEDDTPVAEDDGNKHGSKNKYRIGGDEGKTGPE